MSLTLYKRGGIWHYRGTVAGRRLRGSTSTSIKEQAEQKAAIIETQQWKSHIAGPEAVVTFAQAAMLYRSSGKSARFLSAIEDHWKDTLVKDITAGGIRQSALTLYPKASGATRNRQVVVPTQAIINNAAESELCKKISVKRFPVISKVKRPATLEWVQDFAAASRSPRLSALAWFLFLTGARISEAVAVEWRDVDLQERTVLIRESKIGSERIAHLPAPLVVELANLGGKGRVFGWPSKSTPQKLWRSNCARAGIDQLSPHSCRHGFATALLRQGVDVVTIAKLGGWKTPQHVFQTYGHANDDRTITECIAGTPLTQPIIGEAKKKAAS
jgi:integrase